MTPRYLAIGHVTKDLVDHGYRLGGSAAYAAITAARLGVAAGVVTACGSDLDLSSLRAEAAVHRRPSARTTVFRNVYRGGRRRQFWLSQAATIAAADVPEAWRGADVVHLAPVAQEVDPALARAFPDAFVGMTPQGWLRRRRPNGEVAFARNPEAEAAWDAADAAVLSRDDCGGDRDCLRQLVRRVPVVVITAGRDGCDVYWNDTRRHFGAFAATREVELTGAGDVFAAAFFVALACHRGTPWAAARFASAAASYAVEGAGWTAVAPLWRVRLRLRRGETPPGGGDGQSLCLGQPKGRRGQDHNGG